MDLSWDSSSAIRFSDPESAQPETNKRTQVAMSNADVFISILLHNDLYTNLVYSDF